EMQNAKWTGNAGTDQWNVCVSHSNRFRNPRSAELQVAESCQAAPHSSIKRHWQTNILSLRAGNQIFGFSNFEFATGTLTLISSKVRIVLGLFESAVETRIVNGNFTPSTSR